MVKVSYPEDYAVDCLWQSDVFACRGSGVSRFSRGKLCKARKCGGLFVCLGFVVVVCRCCFLIIVLLLGSSSLFVINFVLAPLNGA